MTTKTQNGRFHIIIFACVDYPEGPATTSRIKLLSKILTLAGHQVSLAIFNANTKTPIPENQTVHGIHEGVEYVYLSDNTVRPTRFSGIVKDTFRGIARSVLYLKSKKISGAADVVLFYTPDIFRSLPCLLLSKLYEIPVLVEMCEIFSFDRRSGGFRTAVKRMGSRFSERLFPRMSSGVLAISTRIAEHLKRAGLRDAPILHLPILVDCERFIQPSQSQVPILSDKKYFLNSGALDGKEGLEVVLKAFAATALTREQIYFALTGDPNPGRKACILGLAKTLGIEQRLIFTGFLPANQLVWACQNAVALICCRADTEFANYGFPTKLAEYLATGRPVITNEVGDTLLYLKDGENAYLTRAGDSDSISEAMEKVLTDSSRADQIGAGGRRVALNEFNYLNFVNPVDAFIRKARSGKHRP